jgi:hypothetical protein
VNLALALLLSGSGVAVAAVAFYNRDKPAWRRDMRGLMLMASMQVVLGAVAWIVLSR